MTDTAVPGNSLVLCFSANPKRRIGTKDVQMVSQRLSRGLKASGDVGGAWLINSRPKRFVKERKRKEERARDGRG